LQTTSEYQTEADHMYSFKHRNTNTNITLPKTVGIYIYCKYRLIQ